MQIQNPRTRTRRGPSLFSFLFSLREHRAATQTHCIVVRSSPKTDIGLRYHLDATTQSRKPTKGQWQAWHSVARGCEPIPRGD